MLGAFIGITASVASMIGIGNSSLNVLTSLLNNPNDVFRLKKFKAELEYTKKFLEGLEITYGLEARDFQRKLNLLRKNTVEADNSFQKRYGIDLSRYSAKDREDLIKEVESELLVFAKKNKLSPEIVNSFQKVGTNETVSLGEWELEVLLNFKNDYLRSIDRYLSLIDISSFEEITVFGDKLYNVAKSNPVSILYRVESMFAEKGLQARDICLRDIEIIKSHYITEEEKVSRKVAVDVTGVLARLSLWDQLVREKGLDPFRVVKDDLDDTDKALLDRFDKKSVKFRNLIENLLTTRKITTRIAEELIQMYLRLFRLDYDVKFLQSYLFPGNVKFRKFKLGYLVVGDDYYHGSQKHDIRYEEVILREKSGVLDKPIEDPKLVEELDMGEYYLTEEEVDRLYDNLSSVGLYGLSRHSSDLFVDTINTLSFSKESRTVIDPDLSVNGNTFSDVIRKVEVLCSGLLPIGMELRG